MWLKRSEFTQMLSAVVASDQKANILDKQNVVLQTTLDWLRVRVTQLEKERQAFLYDRTGIKIAVPEIEAAPEAGASFNDLPSFDDVGDDVAAKDPLLYSTR